MNEKGAEKAGDYPVMITSFKPAGITVKFMNVTGLNARNLRDAARAQERELRSIYAKQVTERRRKEQSDATEK
jgi:hypothetical protein